MPLELEVSLSDCHLPALSEHPSAASEDALRVAQELFDAADWAACGVAFDRVLELGPDANLARDAAYGAVVCSNNVARDHGSSPAPRGRGRGRDAPAPMPVDETPEISAFLARLARGACMMTDRAERAAIAYRRARIYYDRGHAAEAAALFGRIALGAEPDFAAYGAALWLDSLELLRTRPDSTPGQCESELRTAAERVTQRFCGDLASGEDPGLCRTAADIRRAIARRDSR